MALTYDPIFAVDPHNPANVAKNASITIFDPADPAQTPIAITDPTGSPLPNPITVDAAGMGPAYQHPTLARVGWKGAGFVGYFTSYEGMYNETMAAKNAAQAAESAAEAAGADAAAVASAALAGAVSDAEAAADAAATAASLVGAPADTAIAAAVNGNGATKAALSAAIATATTGLASKTEVPALYAQTFEPVVESSLLNGRAALANWENGPAKWMALGDSLTYGWNVTQIAKRYASVAARTLRARLGNAPGMEFIAAAVESPSYYPNPWTVVGTPAKSGFGPARFAHGLSAGHSQSITVTGTTMNVWYTKSPTGGAFNVTVDGGAPTVVNTSYAGSGFSDGFYVTVSLGANTSHSVNISHASGGRAEFTGIEVFTPENQSKGLHLYVAGRPGYKTADYGDANVNNYGRSMQTINPNVITYAIGVNDYAANVDPEVFGANLRVHLASFRTMTTSKPSIVLIPVQLRTGTFTYPWQAYVDEMHQIAGEFADVSVLDMSIRLPAVATDTLGLYADHVHYTDKGAALVGSTLAQFLLPR